MFKLVIIAAGGAVGAVLRYAISGWVQKFANGSFPAGTLFVNMLGCLLIGFAGAFLAGPHLVREEYRVALLVGLLGAFTTFSTFGWETFALANAGQMWLAAANIVLSNGVGLVAVWFGYRLAEKWFGV
jgi:CrcB protein